MYLKKLKSSRAIRVGGSVAVAAGLLGSGFSGLATSSNAAAPLSGVWFQSTNVNLTHPLTNPSHFIGGQGGKMAHGFMSNTGKLVYCALDNKPAPAETLTKTHVYTDLHEVSGAYAGEGDGKFTAEQGKEFAYILNKYGQAGRDWTGAVPSITQQALYVTAVEWAKGYLAHNNKEGEYQKAPTAAVRTEGLRMIAEAKKEAGSSYKSTTTFSGTLDKVGATGKVNISVANDAGTQLTGFPTTVKLANGLQFSDGSTSKSYTTDGKVHTFDVKVVATGKGSASTTVARVPKATYTVAKEASYQTLFIAGDTQTLSSSAAINVTPPVTTPPVTTPPVTTPPVTTPPTTTPPTTEAPKELTPAVMTQASTQTANEGDEIFDTIMGAGFAPNADVKGTADLVSKDGKVIGTVNWSATTNEQGAFSVNTEKIKAPEAGEYSFIEHSEAGTYTDESGVVYNWPKTDGKYGDTGESVTVTKPNTNTNLTPKVTTKASQQTANAGDALYDTIMGEGFAADTDVKGTADLVSKDGKVIGTVNWSAHTDAQGKFTTKTDTISAPAAGEYSFIEHSEAGSVTREGTTISWPKTDGKYGDTGESVTVTTPESPKFTPSVSTQSQNQLVNGKNVPIRDLVKVTGAKPGDVVPVVLSLYGPMQSKPVLSDTVPTDAKLVGTVTVNVTIGKDGRGTATSAPINSVGEGYYVFQESIKATDTYNEYKGKYGIGTETSVNTNVTMKTNVSKDQVADGEAITDTIKVTGTVNQSAKLNVEVYGFKLNNGEKCVASTDDTARWKSLVASGRAKVLDTSTITVTKDGNYTSNAFKTTGGYCYSYGETMTLDNLNNGKTEVAKTHPGEVHEVSVSVKKETPHETPHVTGPTVQTDNVTGSGATDLAAALGILGAVSLGGFAAARKRK